MQCFLQYLGKYTFMKRATRFWKVPWQTNPNLLNKWPLKFACAYLNTQESSPSGTPLKRLQDVRYSMKLSSLLQYFFVLGKSIFLHFLSIWNKFIDIVSGRFELYIKSSRKQPIWNSLETAPGWLNFDIGNVFYIIVRYSMKLSSLLQYFFVLCKSIFLHFLSNWNKFIDIVSGRFELYIKSSSD
ncbi:hypothetical protein T12_6466 [Trichinella patagoniensis]|uniref:Uncharacterized protein n=1 Tax=Trichinella patagoniensis TaxID=990121 RepID=A0A0V1A2W8_9BILA|nr:hypothetical protein T12_6466 [Trichinella patagoniensis]